MQYFDVLSIFSIAFISSLGHCVGMCGGLVIAYTRAKIHNPHALAHNAFLHFLYVCGRVCIYMLLGAIFGSFGAIFTQNMHTKAIVGICVGVLLLIFGFAYLLFPTFLRIFEFSIFPANPTPQNSNKDSTYAQSAKKHSFVIFRLFTYLLTSRSTLSFFLLGMLNGILPCGIVYFFLISAIASGNAFGGAMIMGIFGLATAFIMYPFALFASSLMRIIKPAIFNALAGLCMVGYGGWGIFSNIALL